MTSDPTVSAPAETAPGRPDMAGPDTPFIHNAWYVIGTPSEVTRMPIARTVLGLSIVLFRTQAGRVIALRNRCCHRSFPLVHGALDGDTLVCGYHGLRFDCTGQCIEIPMQKTVPTALRVASFRVEERRDFVWIWMGDPAGADAGALPLQDWMESPEWDTVHAYLHVPGSYVHLHENLLDLSHLSFLHAKAFGTPEYACAPAITRIEGDDIEVWRHVECILPSVYSTPLGWTGMRARRSSGSKFVAPGLHVNTGIFENLDEPERSRNPTPTVKVGQIISPETRHTTHYWTIVARNFARGDTQMAGFMLSQFLAAFSEDVFALKAISDITRLEGDPGFREISIPTDRAGVTMRRRLRALADLEQPAPDPTPRS